MATKKIEIQDSNGNVYYPHTDASVVKNGSKTVAEQLNENTQNISSHKSALATDNNGIHGLKIETGTWTPILAGETVIGSATYTKQMGTYHKIGNFVHCEFWIETSYISEDMSGTLCINGLPFYIKNAYVPSVAIGNLGLGRENSGIKQIGGIGINNSVTLRFLAHEGLRAALAASHIGQIFIMSGTFDFNI